MGILEAAWGEIDVLRRERDAFKSELEIIYAEAEKDGGRGLLITVRNSQTWTRKFMAGRDVVTTASNQTGGPDA